MIFRTVISFIGFCVLIMGLPLKADTPLTVSDVLLSSNKYYPKIEAALAKEEEAKGKTQSTIGAFDSRLEGEIKQRVSGYYTGSTFETRVVKPLAFSNAEVYGGYRLSGGQFPLYESQAETQSAGEVSLGVIFSLLRNQVIDERRFNQKSAELEEILRSVDVLLTRLNVQMHAIHAYAEWVAAGKIVEIYRHLLSLAEERQKNLKGREKAGDIAHIILVENEQNIIKRRAALNEAERSFIRKSNALSLYWRNGSGEPKTPLLSMMPADLTVENLPTQAAVNQRIESVLHDHPELQALELEKKRQKLALEMGENTLLPRLDVGMEVSRDQGDGARNLAGTDAKALVKLTIPLERNLGEGKVKEARASLRRLERQEKLLQDTMRVEILSLAAEIQLTKSNLEISSEEIKLAQKLQQAEQALLENGTSNLFLLNSREERLAEAQVKNVLAKMYLFKSLGSYRAATIDLKNLHIEEKSSNP